MKKEVLVKRLNDDNHLYEIVSMHKEIFIETEFCGKLIYFDNAFENYLKTILRDKNHFIFGVFLNNRIHGFVHMKKDCSDLFLNNIYLDQIVRGGGTGTKVLHNILSMPFIADNGFLNMGLDILRSNSNARKWYNKLGLLQTNIQHWYFAKKKYNIINNIVLKLAYDANNFKGVFFNNIKVGTVIENSCIILHDIVGLNYKCNLPFIIKLSEKELVPEYAELSKFDSTIRMNGDVLTILNTIKNVPI